MTCALLGKSGPRGPWSPWSPLGTSKFKSPNQQVAIPLSSIGIIVFSCAQNPGVIFMDEVALAIAAAPQAWPVLLQAPCGKGDPALEEQGQPKGKKVKAAVALATALVERSSPSPTKRAHTHQPNSTAIRSLEVSQTNNTFAKSRTTAIGCQS